MRRAGKASSAASRIGLGSDIKHPITSREGGGSKKTIVFASLCGEPQRAVKTEARPRAVAELI
jgi:hypothetical protein